MSLLITISIIRNTRIIKSNKFSETEDSFSCHISSNIRLRSPVRIKTTQSRRTRSSDDSPCDAF